MKKQLKLFITGTDTNIGKTYVSAGILTAFNNIGCSTLGIKPVASGCERMNDELRSQDTMTLMQHASIKLDHDDITPFAFEPPIAPHIAAQEAGRILSVTAINEKIRHALHYPADVSVIEGAGGWHVPLNHSETMADFVIANQLEVILVIGIRLGCINHSLLTCQAMHSEGAKIKGWIANCVDPEMRNINENIETLKEWLPIPCLGVIPHGSRAEEVLDVEGWL
jgi:dethiobiotin synthetase